ncbi:MAG: hypothetical protein JWO30_2800 [Fibrobacteres bacterium]|nr:hypothetical protein [Fibrobacterota bacterium]
MHPLRSLLASAAMAGLMLASKAAAAEKTDAFMIHPILSLAISGLHVSYESGFGKDKRWAYEIPFYLGYSEHYSTNATLFTGSGLGVRRYLVDPGKGTFISPEIEIVNLHRFSSGPEARADVLVVVPSFCMGYKWRWNIMTMEAGAGAAFYKSEVTNGNWDTRENRISVLAPIGHFAAGIPF